MFSYLKIGILIAIVTAGGLFYWHYTSIKAERDQALVQVGVLETTVAVQKETVSQLEIAIQEWKNSVEAMQQTLADLDTAQREFSQNMRELNDVLGKHDLEVLSKAKPGLVERRVNSATNDVLGMFECTTGGCKDSSGGDSTP